MRILLLIAAMSLFSALAQATAATPFLTTTPGGTVTIGSGARLTDKAKLSGGFNPTGSIVFELFDPSSIMVDTENVTVNGNGDYNTPTGYLPTVAGTYSWQVTYSGDANNFGALDNVETEKAVLPSVPEPSSLMLLVGGLAGVAGIIRRKSLR